jgi:hypothetical protein
MHRIPGKYGSPRPTVIKFLGIDTNITFLYKKKKINDASKSKSVTTLENKTRAS